MRMPEFYVIGAQKAGTTTLHGWLSTQPNLCLPDIKETHFFSADDRFELGYQWYMRQFKAYNNDKIMGEVDPDYLFMPGVIKRMAQYIESAKFIVILREPLKRAYSHYLMSRYRGFENLSFLEALEAEDNRLSSGKYHSVQHFSYLSRSLYTSQILKFKKSFPTSKFYFVRFDDLFSKHTRENEFLSICKFIAFEANMSAIDFELVENVSSIPRSKIIWNAIYNDKSVVREFIRPFARLLTTSDLRLRIALKVDKINRKNNVRKGGGLKNTVDIDVPMWVKKKFQRDLIDLQAITGLDFSSW